MTKRKRVARAMILINVMEFVGWSVFLFNSTPPMTYGVLLLWGSSLLRKATP